MDCMVQRAGQANPEQVASTSLRLTTDTELRAERAGGAGISRLTSGERYLAVRGDLMEEGCCSVLMLQRPRIR